MDPMALAGMFCQTAAGAADAPCFPLTWVRCGDCGLVQVLEDVPDHSLYSEYNYASSTVPGLVRHFAGFAATLSARYPADGMTYLEIGCNDGVLLGQLPSRWRRIGVDPSDVARRGAAGGSHELVNRPFTPELVRECGLEGRVDVISGSNCLAHISDLKAVFEAAALALRPGGHFWIEVHDLRATLDGAQWDTIYHEHKVEWSEAALTRCLAPLGFARESTDRLPLHGGLLRVRLRRESGPCSLPAAEDAAEDLQRLADAYRNRREHPVVRRLLGLRDQGKTVAAYGASGRANVYLNQIPELGVAYIVDESPLRCGRFIPRTGTPIVPPARLLEQPADACLVTAWNYSGDIIRKNPGHQGLWCTAFGHD
jgi:SAM-dependent methyltransferase